MQYYVNFDDSGDIAGFYVDVIHGDKIPQMAVPITIEEWRQFSNDASKYKLDKNTIRLKTQEEIDEDRAARLPAPPSDADRIAQLEADNALLSRDLAEAHARLTATEKGQAALLLQLVQGGVL